MQSACHIQLTNKHQLPCWFTSLPCCPQTALRLFLPSHLLSHLLFFCRLTSYGQCPREVRQKKQSKWLSSFESRNNLRETCKQFCCVTVLTHVYLVAFSRQIIVSVSTPACLHCSICLCCTCSVLHICSSVSRTWCTLFSCSNDETMQLFWSQVGPHLLALFSGLLYHAFSLAMCCPVLACM